MHQQQHGQQKLDDVIGAMPNMRPQIEQHVETVWNNVSFILHLYTFDIEHRGTEIILKKDGKELIVAPSRGDMILMLCITGALANLKNLES